MSIQLSLQEVPPLDALRGPSHSSGLLEGHWRRRRNVYDIPLSRTAAVKLERMLSECILTAQNVLIPTVPQPFFSRGAALPRGK